MKQFKIMGLRQEKGLDSLIESDGGEIIERVQYIICLEAGNQKYELTLSTQECEDGPSPTLRTDAHISLGKVKNFSTMTHTCIGTTFVKLTDKWDNLLFECVEEGELFIMNNVFTYSDVGSGAYYPSGYYYINMKLFKPLK